MAPNADVPDIDREAALARLMELLSISAPTGEEKPVSDHLRDAFTRLGVPEASVRIDDAPARISLPCQVGNLIVTLPGTTGGPRRLLSAHMDTVPLARHAVPMMRGERIVPKASTALGGDDRTGVAALLVAIAEIHRRRLPHPPVTFLFTVREESGLRGAAAARLQDLGAPAMGFNFDGSLPNEVTVGATGAVKMDIDVRGIASHAGVHPERGISAIAILAAAVRDLDQGGWLGLVRKPEGSGTSNIGAVSGGEATNVVTEHVTARAEARSHDPAFLERLVGEYQRAFSTAAREHRNDSGKEGSAAIQVEKSYYSYALDEDSPVVRAAAAAVAALGLTPRTRRSNGGLDANWLTRNGLPTVSLGCGQHEIHTTSEYVMVDEYLTACRLALLLATGASSR